MYQGMQNQPQYNGSYYQQANPYGAQYQQRYAPVDPIQPAYSITPTNTFLKGRPVVSIDEARAASIDLDGSLHVFTDIGNKKIYTKQINLDGTATLNIYNLQEEVPVESLPEYVTKIEFNQALSNIQEILNAIIPKEEKKTLALNNF